MIIEMLLNVIKNLLNVLLFFEIPPLPEDVTGYFDTLFGYLETGASILSNYTPLSYLLVLFGIILAVDAAIIVYHFVMWILRKIPVAGIS